MEDPSGEDFSQISNQLTNQLTEILTEMIPSVQTRANVNGLINFRMTYTNPFESNNVRPPTIRNLVSLARNFPRTPFFTRRNPLTTTTMSDILRHSMENTGGTKKVATDELLESIAKIPECTDISVDEECPICMDGFSDGNGIKVECSHIFHRDCITEWLRGDNRCPVCRHEYPSKEISLAPVVDTSGLQVDPPEDISSNVDELDPDTESDTDEEIVQPLNSIPSRNIPMNTAMNSAIRSLETMLRGVFVDTVEDELREERMIQQAIFESIHEPIPHDISGSNNESA